MVAIEFHVVMQIDRVGALSPRMSLPGVGGVGSGFIGFVVLSMCHAVTVSFYTVDVNRVYALK
jgi:hypothetical protein